MTATRLFTTIVIGSFGSPTSSTISPAAMKSSIVFIALAVVLCALFVPALHPQLHAQKHTVFAVLHDENNLGIVDPTSGKLVQRIQVGRDPDMIALNGDNTRLYVSNTGEISVSIVSIPDAKVVQSLRLPVNRRNIYAGPLTRLPDGSKIFVAERGENNEELRVYVIDTKKELIVSQFDAGKNVAALAVSHDGSRLFVLNKGEGVRVFDTQTLAQLGTVELLAGLAADVAGLACSPTEAKGYLSFGNKNRIEAFNTETYKSVKDIPVPKYNTGTQGDIVCSANGKWAYVVNRKVTLKEVDGVNVIDTQKDEIVKLFNSGVIHRGIMSAPSGDLCYIAAEELKWYNMSTLEHLRSISLRTPIYGIVVLDKK